MIYLLHMLTNDYDYTSLSVVVVVAVICLLILIGLISVWKPCVNETATFDDAFFEIIFIRNVCIIGESFYAV